MTDADTASGTAATEPHPTGVAPEVRCGRRGARSEERSGVWQDRADGLVMAASVLAVIGVALQTRHPAPALPWLGLGAAAVSWLIFAAVSAVMLTVSPQPRAWARSHTFDLVVLAVACPVWPMLFHDLLIEQRRGPRVALAASSTP